MVTILGAGGAIGWEPLCYAQIGGLTIATFVTLGLVPVLYSVVVLDLQWIRWGHEAESAHAAPDHEQEVPEISNVPLA
jgi:multidrug efflux pump